MKKNQGSLTFPSNPLAAMRELQDLDAPPASTTATHEPVATHEPIIVTPPAEDAIGLEDTTDNTLAHTTSSIVTLPTERLEPAEDKIKKPSTSARNTKSRNTTSNTTILPVTYTTSNTTTLPTSNDSLRTALLQTIQHPIAGDMSKGPFSVSSIKVHNTVWERLGYVAQLTGRNKQDLISEALLDLFVKIAHEEGEH